MASDSLVRRVAKNKIWSYGLHPPEWLMGSTLGDFPFVREERAANARAYRQRVYRKEAKAAAQRLREATENLHQSRDQERGYLANLRRWNETPLESLWKDIGRSSQPRGQHWTGPPPDPPSGKMYLGSAQEEADANAKG